MTSYIYSEILEIWVNLELKIPLSGKDGLSCMYIEVLSAF